MNYNEYVSNIILSKKLKNLNVKQESLFYWCYSKRGIFSIKCNLNKLDENNLLSECDDVQFSAFTSSELMEIMPACIKLNNNLKFHTFYLNIDKINNDVKKYITKYVCDENGVDRYGNIRPIILDGSLQDDEIFVNALAKTLIHILELRVRNEEYSW